MTSFKLFMLSAIFISTPFVLGAVDPADYLRRFTIDQLFKLSAMVQLGIMLLFLGLVSCAIR